MGLLDRLLGRSRSAPGSRPAPQYDGRQYDGRQAAGEQLPDEQAVARYRYLLRTAPPEQIEQAHAEAFAQLSTDQRQQVLVQLATTVPAAERPRTDDAATLARVATRVEMAQPGTLERVLGGYGPGYGAGGQGPAGYGGRDDGGGYGGPGMGSMIGGSLLGTIGGLVVGTAIADALLDGALFDGGGDVADSGGFGGGDFGGGDFGGGDFGGGDFGGGDF